MRFTIDRINAMLKRCGKAPAETWGGRGHLVYGFRMSVEAEGCALLERIINVAGSERGLRFHMKGGARVKMLLGERVTALETEIEEKKGKIHAEG